MNIKSCLTVAFREFIHSVRIFLLYFIILVCLESITITILRAASDTPDKISDIAKELGYNYISVKCCEIGDAERFFEKNDAKLEHIRSDISFSFKSQIFNYNSNSGCILSNDSEGVICETSKLKDNYKIYLSENMISGNTDFNSDDDYIWISDELSRFYNINAGDALEYSFPDPDQDSYVFEVAGIYKADKDICCLFITDCAYEKVRNMVAENTQEKYDVLLKCSDLKKIGEYIDILKKYDMNYSYSDEMYSAVNMMFASFYASVVILFAALTGIMIYLSDLYFSKRRDFYAVNYIIGMPKKDIVRIIFILLGMLLIISLMVSGCICMLIMNYFDNYLFDLFGIDFELRGFPINQFIISFVILAVSLFFVLFRIKSVISKTFSDSSGRNL